MKTIELTLSLKSINNAISELKAYKQWLHDKNQLFVEVCADVGKITAEQYVADFPGALYKVVEGDGCAYLIGYDERQLRTWYSHGKEVKNYDYSPVLMAEFGSGAYALEGFRGTFPTQTKHGLKDQWYYRPTQYSQPVYTSGEEPTRPMQHAMDEILDKYRMLAEMVFKDD